MYKLIIIPEGAVLPEDLQHLAYQGTDIVDKIYAGRERAVIISVSVRELQMLVEYRDLFDAEPKAVIGMQGAMYNTVWNTYVATMERTTLDALRADLRKENDALSQSGMDAIARPSRDARVARLRPQAPVPAEPDESDFPAE